jgi:hypothetical protein
MKNRSISTRESEEKYNMQQSGGRQLCGATGRAIIHEPTFILTAALRANPGEPRGCEIRMLPSARNEDGATSKMVSRSPSDKQYAHPLIYHFDGQPVTERFNAVVLSAL